MDALTVSKDTLARLKKVADAKGAKADELAERAIRQFLRDEARRMMQREMDAFRNLHAELLVQHLGEYVAVYQGQLVDRDADQLALLTRIEERYPGVPVLIKQVLPEPEEVYAFRSPRLENERQRIPSTG